MKKNKKIKCWLVHLIPLIWFIFGILYSRTLEPWAGIGMSIMVLISTAGLLAGTITWHYTKKVLYAIIATVISTLCFFFLVILLARSGW